MNKRKKWSIMCFILALAFSAYGLPGQSSGDRGLKLPYLAGAWTSSGLAAAIAQDVSGNLVFTNERGNSSKGRFIDAGTVIASAWEGGLIGVLQDGNSTIRWANGTAWYRQQDAGRRVATTAVTDGEFLHAPGGVWERTHSGDMLNYITWDGSQWSAKLHGNGFLLAPDGDWNKAYADAVLNYVAWDGTKWAAKIHSGGFLHAPNGDWSRAQANAVISYFTWAKTKWSSKIVQAETAKAAVVTTPPVGSGQKFLHAPEGDWSRAHPDEELKYIAWDDTKWIAKLHGNGFLLAPNGNWSKARVDAVLNYVSWDGTKWSAKVLDNNFVNAPKGDWSRRRPGSHIQYVTWNKTKWTAKVREGLRGRKTD